MKIDLVRDEVAEHDGLEVSQMSFDMSKTAKLFHMLSSTLYSDKIGSVIRELSSNAYDSHLEAGKLDVPFVLTAPTYENLVFSIRDYGVGLTAEQAEKTILCYLGSSKDTTDKFIGGWGIGSKSPFAYAMNYEVLVFKDKQFAHYTCWKNESGIPEKTIIDSGHTDQENGVEIRVPVEAKDMSSFVTSLQGYMNWTNYNVVLKNGDETVEPRVPVVVKEFDNFKIKVYKSLYSSFRKLVYGGFSYDIDQCVNGKYDYYSTWSNMNRRLRQGFDIAFVIDEPNVVTFNMNREVLEQTPKSVEFINKLLNVFLEAASKREKVIENLSKTSLDGSKRAKNLKELQDNIDEINNHISGIDKSFDVIFLDKNIDMPYHFRSPMKMLSSRHVTEWRTLYSTLESVEDQLKIVWSTRARPGPEDRNKFFYNKSYKDKFLFFKAKNLEDCKKQISELSDFEGFDVDSLHIEELEIEKVSKSNFTRGKSDKPVVYCKKLGKRLPYDEDNIYIERDPTIPHTEDEKMFLKFNSASDLYVFLLPSDNTRKNLEIQDCEFFNNLVKEWIEEKINNYVPTKFQEKVENYIYRQSYEFGYLPSIKKLKGDIEKSRIRGYHDRKEVREFELYLLKNSDLSTFKRLKDDFKNVKKLSTVIKGLQGLVNLENLIHHKDDNEYAKLIVEKIESKGVKL